MALLAFPGNGFCCCPDCVIFQDNFDCCPGQAVYPCSTQPCWEYGYGYSQASGSYGTIVEMISTDDLGPAWDWKYATGIWVKSASSWPEQVCSGGIDGALYELSGSGSLKCDMVWPNPGWLFQIDLIYSEIGTKFIMHVGVDSTGTSKIDVTFWVKEVAVPPGGYSPQVHVVISVNMHAPSGDGTVHACSWDIWLNEVGVAARHNLTAAYDGILGYFGAEVDVLTLVPPMPLLTICNAPKGLGPSVGDKVVMENASGVDAYGKSIPIELDNFILYKEKIYPNQECLPIPSGGKDTYGYACGYGYGYGLMPQDWCFMFVDCLCTDPTTGHERKKPYSKTMSMTVIAHCNDGSTPSVTYTLNATAPSDPCNCPLNLINNWQTGQMPCAPGGSWVNFVLSCTSQGFQVYEYDEYGGTSNWLLTTETCLPFRAATYKSSVVPGCGPPCNDPWHQPYTADIIITE